MAPNLTQTMLPCRQKTTKDALIHEVFVGEVGGGGAGVGSESEGVMVVGGEVGGV